MFEQGLAFYQQGNFAQAEKMLKRTLEMQPHHFDALHFLGIIAVRTNRPEKGVALIERSIKLIPHFAAAHNSLGMGLQTLKRYDEALVSYDKAIALNPGYAEAYNNRGNALQEMNRLEEALSSYDKAIALEPNYAEAYSNRGTTLHQMNRHDEALASYDRAIDLKPDHASAYYNCGIALLVLGRFEQGWQQYEWRKKIRPPLVNRFYQQPLWLGKENIAGKVLFLYCEQGLGDTIQFIRYAKLLRARGAKVIVSIQDPLLRLLKRMDPNIEFIGGDAAPDGFEYHCPLMSLPLALGTTLETIPSEPFYLQVDAELSAQWKTRLSELSGLRVGLVWAGGKRGQRSPAVTDSRRSISLATYAPLASIPNVSFISLQKGPPADQARMPPEGMILHDWTDELLDFLDTAALIDGLDLVISVDTAVAHLAGALGKPVWVLNRSDTCWRWMLGRTDSPWYPSLRLFRQREMGNWSSVVEEVKRELQSLSESCGMGQHARDRRSPAPAWS